jgi:hypothetical protein
MKKEISLLYVQILESYKQHLTNACNIMQDFEFFFKGIYYLINP